MRSDRFRASLALLILIVLGAVSVLVAQRVAPGGDIQGQRSTAPGSVAGPGGPPEPWPEAKAIAPPKDDQDLVSAIPRLADELASTGRFSGSILVAAKGNVLLNAAWGEADETGKVRNRPETSFDVGSIGKLFTQIAILQLAEAGKLSLDDKFAKYLPEYPDHDIATKVTLRQLLLHTSGMGDIFDHEAGDTKLGSIRDLRDFLPLIVGKPLAFEPGSSTHYSNAGYIVLGLVIEAASGENYDRYIEQHILHPAEMTHSGFFDRSHLPATVARSYDDHRDVTGTYPPLGSPAGGLQATAADLFRLIQAINAGKLLAPESVKLLRALIPHPPNAAPPADETKLTGYGIVGGAPGVSAQLVVDPTGVYTWIVLCNGNPPMAMTMGATIRQWIKALPR